MKYSVENNSLGKMIDENVYKFFGSTFFKLKEAESWRGRSDRACVFKKEEKEALNAMIAVILWNEYAVKENKEVNFDACIAYIINRIIRKSLTWDYKPENILYIRQNFGGYTEKEAVYVRELFEKATSEEFVDEIVKSAAKISSEEEMIFQVAKHFAHWIEYEQIKGTIYKENRRAIKRDLKKQLKEYNVKNYVSKPLSKLVYQMSWSRNIVRWQSCGSILECNILCHMLETAIFGWLMAHEFNRELGFDKFSPAQVFMIGLYHDISEIWTDDIPSPCKNGIGSEQDGLLRAVTEMQERVALSEHFYAALSPKVAKYFKQNIMLEELEDKELHKLLKNADYFSADYECYWQIAKGSRILKFANVIKSSIDAAEENYSKSNNVDISVRTPECYKVLKEWWEEKLSKLIFLEP